MRRLKALLVTGVLLASWILAPGQVLAATIFDNFGPGDTYETNFGATLSGPTSSPGEYDAAMGFTPVGMDFFLDRIELAAALAQGANELDLWLMTDVGGLPGAIIESFHFSGAMGSFGQWNPPLSVDSVLHPYLSAGTQYWLAGSAPDDTWAVWNMNSIGDDTGPRVYRTTGSWIVPGDQTRAAFRVSGTPIPEPTTLTLLGAGTLGLIGYLRRRRKLT